jgi:hypothetical protein
MYTDPTGMYTQRDGYEAEEQIQAIYKGDHKGNKNISCGTWTRLPYLSLFKLKPDILNWDTSRWLEIKRLTPSGLVEAQAAVFKYAPLMLFDIRPDTEWEPSKNEITINGRPAWFANAGCGIVFYTDEQALEDEIVTITSIYAARLLLRQITLQVGSMVTARVSADTVRLDQYFSIACMLGLMGGIIL